MAAAVAPHARDPALTARRGRCPVVRGACFLVPPAEMDGTRGPGARSARSQLPGETDNEDETELLEEPAETRPLSRPGSAHHVLLPVEESLSIDGVSPHRTLSTDGLSPQKDDSLLGGSLEVSQRLQHPRALACTCMHA